MYNNVILIILICSDKRITQCFLPRVFSSIHLFQSSSASVGFDYPHEPYDLSGYSYDDPTQQVVFSTFEASLEVLHDPGSSEYSKSLR